jgi:uncharacterized membrane protein YkvA (DUF1232 family)
MNLKEKARNLKMNIQVIFVAFQKKETPWYAKVMAAITIGYALSPIDFIPDFIPVLGYLDDLILLPLLIMISIRLIPKDVMEQSRQEAQHLWENGKPKKWYYSVPIILIKYR